MALFRSRSPQDEDDYSPTDESKPLREERERVDDDDDDREGAPLPAELYALSRSLRRTNLFLKIIIGLLVVCILALASINVPDSVKKILKSTKCDDEPMLKTPVPPRM